MSNLEINLLLLRNEIANKEFVISRANRDIQEYGSWQCDYEESFAYFNHMINELSNKIAKSLNSAHYQQSMLALTLHEQNNGLI